MANRFEGDEFTATDIRIALNEAFPEATMARYQSTTSTTNWKPIWRSTTAHLQRCHKHVTNTFVVNAVALSKESGKYNDLASHSCLSFRTKPGKNYWTFDSPEGAIDVPISGRLNVNGLVFLRNAAVDGLGIIMIPTWMMRDELKRELPISLLEDFPVIPPSTPINAIFAHNRHLAPKVRAFVDFLAERMETL